jgi:fructokinase
VITVIGEALVNLVPGPGGGVLRALPGGSAFSTAVRAARLGYPTALMARLSRDPFGQILRRHASRYGVDLSASPDADEPTMIAVAASPSGPDGEGSLYYHGTASWQWSSAELGWIPADTTVLHLDSLACCVPPGSTRILRAASRYRSRGAIVCLNLNIKAAVVGSPARGRLLLDRPIRSADVVRASLEDLAWLYPGRPPEAVAQMWLAAGPQLAVLTRGSDGVVAVRNSGVVLHRAARSAAVGAGAFGPAFTGALLGGLHQLSQAGMAVAELATSDLAAMIDRALAAAATTSAGSADRDADPAVAAEPW